MRSAHGVAMTMAAIALLTAAPSWAICPASDCSSSASTVLVREDCEGLANCFEEMALLFGTAESENITTGNCQNLVIDNTLALGEWVAASGGAPCKTNGWMWSVRNPSASSPVVVDVGPGAFEDAFVCPFNSSPRRGHVKLRGAGRDVSTIFHIKAAISVFGCEDLAFSELTARALIYGVRWIGGGEATWSRVDMIADAPEFWGVSLYDGLRSGWGDECYATGDSATSVHFIHDSRSVVSGHGPMNVGYVSDCADTYYSGGAIVNHTTGGVHGSWGGLWGVLVGRFGTSSVSRFFGLDVDIVVDVDRASSEQVIGVGVEDGSFADLQDGSIELDIRPDGIEATSTNAIGIQTSSGTARSLSTPMDLKTTSGSSIPRQDL